MEVLSTSHIDFSGILSKKRNHHHFSDDFTLSRAPTYLSSRCQTLRSEDEMKILSAGFPRTLCDIVIQSCDRHSNRSFPLLRISDFNVDAVDTVDVSKSEFVMIPSSEHLAFSDITYNPDFMNSSPIFLLRRVFLDF